MSKSLSPTYNQQQPGASEVVPSQVEVVEGTAAEITQGHVWILENISPGDVHTYVVTMALSFCNGAASSPSHL